MKIRYILACLFFALPSFAAELVLYSTRKEQLLEPLLKAYEEHSGHRLKVVYDSEGPLLERLKREGSKSPADLFMVVDAGNLWKASDLGLLAPIKSKSLEAAVPASLRDPQGQWFALTRRVRGIVYHPKKVDPKELSTYEDLASAKWKGKLCLRSSSKVYNQSLVAMMIERLGTDKTRAVVKGWVDNLGAKVFSDDTSLIKAIESGPCHVGLVNSYYLGRLIADNPQYPVKMFWPNQGTGSSGAHVNISGVGVTRSSQKKALAQSFIEWSVSPQAQKILSDINLEFPITTNLVNELNSTLKTFGDFQPENFNLAIAGRRQREAVILMETVGYQ